MVEYFNSQAGITKVNNLLAKVSELQERADEAEKCYVKLGNCIADAAKKLGIYNGEVPVGGPHLLMFMDDIVQQFEQLNSGPRVDINRPFVWIVESLKEKGLYCEANATKLLMDLRAVALESYNFEKARRNDYENKEPVFWLWRHSNGKYGNDLFDSAEDAFDAWGNLSAGGVAVQVFAEKSTEAPK